MQERYLAAKDDDHQQAVRNLHFFNTSQIDLNMVDEDTSPQTEVFDMSAIKEKLQVTKVRNLNSSYVSI